MNDAMHARLSDSHGREAADALYLRFVQSYATHVARLDPDMFHAGPGEGALAAALSAYHAETDEPFPQDPARQLAEVLRSMARAWEGTTARLLRQAKGAPPDAVLGLLVQRMALGIGPGISEALVQQGCSVELALTAPALGGQLPLYVRDDLAARLHGLGVKVTPYARLYGVAGGTVYLQHTASGTAIETEADTVVLCLGHRPEDQLRAELAGLPVELVTIGDAMAARTAEEAVFEGLKAACLI